jgi:hypothetical protein
MSNGGPFLGVDVGGTKVALRCENDREHGEDVHPWPASGTVEQDLEHLAR